MNLVNIVIDKAEAVELCEKILCHLESYKNVYRAEYIQAILDGRGFWLGKKRPKTREEAERWWQNDNRLGGLLFFKSSCKVDPDLNEFRLGIIQNLLRNFKSITIKSVAIPLDLYNGMVSTLQQKE